jgi:CD2 antigen cytoplasmic tail-binding protein 2
MQPKEDINKTLQRLNKSKMKISTAQRFKMKKQGITDEASEQITKLTGLTNEVLTKTGNMNVYDLTYEQIQLKVSKSETPTAGGSKDVELDMYADDFDEKEKEKKVDPKAVKIAEEIEEKETELMWEYKMKAEDEKIQGPFTTFIMSKKAENGDFKDGAVARKVGDERFYSASRIDFELYL